MCTEEVIKYCTEPTHHSFDAISAISMFWCDANKIPLRKNSRGFFCTVNQTSEEKFPSVLCNKQLHHPNSNVAKVCAPVFVNLGDW